MTVLTMLGGAYCAGTYYAHRGFLRDALDAKHGTGWRVYAAGMFGLAPITAPINFGLAFLVMR